MASESKDGSGSAAAAAGTGVHVFVHPLPLIAIAEHHTRVREGGALDCAKDARVLGVLFGTQSGIDIHVAASYELLLTPAGGVDLAFLRDKRQLITEVYPTYEILGLYSTSLNNDTDMALMEMMADFNAGLFLVMNPNAQPKDDAVPVTVFQREVHILDGDKARSVLVQVPFGVDASEPERVTTEHLAKTTTAAAGSASTLTASMTAVKEAVQALSERVGIMRTFLAAVHSGEIEPDHTLLRQVHAICALLPAVTSTEFDAEYFAGYNDSLLVTYLATITNALQGVHESIKKLKLSAADKRRGGRRMNMQG